MSKVMSKVMSKLLVRTLGASALVLGVASGCPFEFTNQSHCAANEGDQSCSGDRPFCALDGCGLYEDSDNRTGCVAERPAENSCYSPCGAEQTADENGECIATTGTDTDPTGPGTTLPPQTTTTQGDSSTSLAGCDCDETLPLCIDDVCVACEDNNFCDEQFGEMRSLCEAGDCVECRPVLESPGIRHEGCGFIDLNCGADRTCGPVCLFHEDCGDTGCDSRDGICGPADLVFFIDPAGDNSNEGTAEQPFRTIQRGVDAIGRQTRDEPFKIGTLMLASATYTETVVVESRTVIVRPMDERADAPVMRAPEPAKGDDPEPALTLLQNGAETIGGGIWNVRGVDMIGSPGVAVLVQTTGRYYADDVRMQGNVGAIFSEGGGVFFRNSIVADNTDEPPFVFVDGSEFAFVSTTVVENNVGGLLFDCRKGSEGTRLSIRDTIVGNIGGPDLADLKTDLCEFSEGDPQRIVEGADIVAGAFREGYLLDVNPGAAFELDSDAVMYCEPGQQIDPKSFLKPCPPTRDISGTSRVDGPNFKGASVP